MTPEQAALEYARGEITKYVQSLPFPIDLPDSYTSKAAAALVEAWMKGYQFALAEEAS